MEQDNFLTGMSIEEFDVKVTGKVLRISHLLLVGPGEGEVKGNILIALLLTFGIEGGGADDPGIRVGSLPWP